MNLEEFLVHPLFLLVVGTISSYFIGTKLTRRYQEQQKARDIEREDLHRSIQIKDGMIRQFSDVTVEFEQMIFTIQLAGLNKRTIEDVISDFHKLQLTTTRLMLLIKLYFGEKSSIYNKFAKFGTLQYILKNYGINKKPELEKEIQRLLNELTQKEFSDVSEKYIQKMGLESNFFTTITKKIGLWGFDFSQEILETKFKIQK